MRVLTAGLVFLLLAVSLGSAAAQVETREGIALQNQILELRRDLQTLRDQIAAGGAAAGPRYRNEPVPNTAPNDMLASLLDRVLRLEDQVRQLQGRADETANQLQRQGEDFTKQFGDMNFRLQALENGGRGGPPSGAPPGNPGLSLSPPPGALVLPQGAGPGESVPPPRTPELALQQGSAALARRDYAAAEAAARDALARGGPRSYDAQFLLAQALMGKRDFQQAAIAYDDTYNRSRTGSHAQDALLGLANALATINERRSACETLNRLRAEFPQARPDVRDAAAGLRLRAGC